MGIPFPHCMLTLSWQRCVAWACSRIGPPSVAAPLASRVSGRGQSFTVQSWLPVTTKDSFSLGPQGTDQLSPDSHAGTPVLQGWPCSHCPHAAQYLEQQMAPTLCVCPEPCATHTTLPSLPILQMRML